MFEKYIKTLKWKLTKWVNKALDVLDKSIEAKSPVDTGEYIAGNKRMNADKKSNKIVWEVYNNSDYGYQVEYWFVSKQLNWHKNKKLWWPVIYTWVWARTYTRTRDEKEKEVKDILINSIK